MRESFIKMLEAYGEAHPPTLAYRADRDVREWQTALRAAVDTLLGPLPERAPCEAETVESVQEKDHVRHVLAISVNRFATLPANLLLPADRKEGERRPGLLVFHGHAEYGMDSVCGVRGMEAGDNAQRAYALAAVRAGFVVLAPAWWGWHGRDGHVDRTGGRDKCNVIQMAAGMYGLNVLNLHMQDAAAAMDVLAERPEVAADRIGCLGNSYGGRTAMWFTILDARVRACVASGCMNTFRERSLKLSSCAIQYPPGILAYGDVPELFCLIAPRPLQLQAGEQDRLITPSDRDHIHRTVLDAYRRLNAEAAYEYHRHPGGHILLWPPAQAFLERCL
jgi:dienelactone hydrolase